MTSRLIQISITLSNLAAALDIAQEHQQNGNPEGCLLATAVKWAMPDFHIEVLDGKIIAANDEMQRYYEAFLPNVAIDMHQQFNARQDVHLHSFDLIFIECDKADFAIPARTPEESLAIIAKFKRMGVQRAGEANLKLRKTKALQVFASIIGLNDENLSAMLRAMVRFQEMQAENYFEINSAIELIEQKV